MYNNNKVLIVNNQITKQQTKINVIFIDKRFNLYFLKNFYIIYFLKLFYCKIICGVYYPID